MNAFIPRQSARGFIIPDFISDNNTLSIGAKMLYGVLCDYARDKAYCYPSKHTLAKRLQCSINTIKAYLLQLKDNGFLLSKLSKLGKEIFYLFSPTRRAEEIKATEHIQTAEQTQTAEVASIPQEAKNIIKSAQKKFTPTRQILTEGVSNFDPKANVNINTIYPPTPQTHEQKNTQAKLKRCVWDFKTSKLEFEKFWEVYPKKERKEDALQAWLKFSKRGKLPPFEVLKKAIDYFLESSSAWHRENGRYVPHAVNFIRGLRWCDVPGEVFKPKKSNIAHHVPIVEDIQSFRGKLQKEEKEQHLLNEKNKKINAIYERLKSFFLPMGKIDDCYAYALFSDNHLAIEIPKEKQAISLLEFLKQRR